MSGTRRIGRKFCVCEDGSSLIDKDECPANWRPAVWWWLDYHVTRLDWCLFAAEPGAEGSCVYVVAEPPTEEQLLTLCQLLSYNSIHLIHARD